MERLWPITERLSSSSSTNGQLRRNGPVSFFAICAYCVNFLANLYFTTGHKKKGDNRTKFAGKITVNNLSEEYSANELDFDISCDSSSPDANDLKEFLRTEGPKYLRQQLGSYITGLKLGNIA